MNGTALINLADIALCTSNDLHTMHLNYKGTEFDTMHKKVLQKYYDKAAEDADTWYEAAAMFETESPSLNDAARRLNWQSVEGMFNYNSVVQKCDELLQTYCAALLLVYNALNDEQCYLSVGVQNTVQTAIEYWSKEQAYFNARRN